MNATTSSLDQIVAAFQQQSLGWGAAFSTAANGLFWLLVLIEFVLSGVGTLMRQDGFGSVPAWLIRQIMVIGFWQWILQNATLFATDIVTSLQQLAQQAGAPAMTPSAIFSAGVNVASTVASQVSILHPADSAGLILCAIVILIAFALICCWMIVTLCEAWALCGLAVLFIAFGGISFSRDVAMNLLRYALAVGFKLLTLELLVGIGSSFIQQWGQGTDAGSITFQGLFIMIGIAITLAALAKLLPDLVQRIIAGSAFSVAHYGHLTSSAVGAASLVAAPVIGAAGGTALAGMAAKQGAERLAQRDAEGTAPSGFLGRLAVGSGAALSLIGQAAKVELLMRTGGRIRGGSGIVRMAQTAANERRLRAAENAKPQQSSDP